jgi:uncharacterized damage-inducible protein DinB
MPNLRSVALAAFVPAVLGAQAPARNSSEEVMWSYEHFADIFGSRLVAAFDSIPASRYDYRPTSPQQTIGYIAQHVEQANYGLCAQFSDLTHPKTEKDALPDSVKARWPKDTLVARLRASLQFCDAALERVGRLESGELTSRLLAFETDLAEHYSQLSSYMRALGMVPPSALPTKKRTAIALPESALSPLVGVYQIAHGPQLFVTRRGVELFVRSSGGGDTIKLWPESRDEFFVNEVDAQITAMRDASGRVTALVLHQLGRDRTAPRTR